MQTLRYAACSCWQPNNQPRLCRLPCPDLSRTTAVYAHLHCTRSFYTCRQWLLAFCACIEALLHENRACALPPTVPACFVPQASNNLQALSMLMRNQQIDYDFGVYNLPMPADVPVTILSEGPSMLSSAVDLELPINTAGNCTHVCCSQQHVMSVHAG